MKAKLTKRKIDALKSSVQDQFVWDADIAGFGLKITPKGKKIYVFDYRVKATRKKRRYTIGTHGESWTPDKARKIAGQLRTMVEAGGDPNQERQNQREQAATTVKLLAEKYLAEYAEVFKKPLSVRDDRSMIRRFITPELGTKAVVEVTERDVAKLHNKLRATPFQANRVAALLGKMFNLAESPWGIRDRNTNPCTSLKKFNEASKARKRFLTTKELKRLSKVLRRQENDKPYVVAAIRLLLLTGARLSEILTAKWSYVHLDKAEIHLPDSKAGFKVIHLPPPALIILSELDQVDGCPYVIVGGRTLKGDDKGKLGNLKDLQKPWQEIRRLAKIEDVRLHDLRHTYASILAAAGFGLPVIGELLGHRNASTTKRYAHLGNDPLKVASNAAADRLNATLKIVAKDDAA